MKLTKHYTDHGSILLPTVNPMEETTNDYALPAPATADERNAFEWLLANGYLVTETLGHPAAGRRRKSTADEL